MIRAAWKLDVKESVIKKAGARSEPVKEPAEICFEELQEGSEDIDKLNEPEDSQLVAAPPIENLETLVENVLKERNDNGEELTDLEGNSVFDCDRPPPTQCLQYL